MYLKDECIVKYKEICEVPEKIVEGLRFCTKYNMNYEKETMLLLRMYGKRSFIYFLVSNYGDKKCLLYIGQSTDIYSRICMHKVCYEYDELYLFYVSDGMRDIAEKMLIEYFAPMYNKNFNEKRVVMLMDIGMSYDEYKSREIIQKDIKKLEKSQMMSAVSFYIPKKYVIALGEMCEENNMSISNCLSDVLKKSLPKEKVVEAIERCDVEKCINSEFVTTKEYAKKSKKSVEQVKVYCRSGRIPALKLKRDWIIPKSALYPEDRRKK